MKVGIISDTHGFWHPDLECTFEGVDAIVHAGDIGGFEILDRLAEIAPVTAVRGNYDTEPEIQHRLLDDPSRIEFCGKDTFLTHRFFTMDLDTIRQFPLHVSALPDPPELVIFGHTHFSVLEKIHGIWMVNPGYAGPDPVEGPTTVALLDIKSDSVSGRIVELQAL